MAELKELRKFMGITQKDLAEKAGINIRHLQKIESGEVKVENITAKSLMDLINMNKLEDARRLSKIGAFRGTFNKCYERIPEGLFEKLSAQQLADLIDAFYDAYSDGKNAKERE